MLLRKECKKNRKKFQNKYDPLYIFDKFFPVNVFPSVILEWIKKCLHF